MKVGDLVKDKEWASHVAEIGMIIAIDHTQNVGDYEHPYQVQFANGETHWMCEALLEVINASR